MSYTKYYEQQNHFNYYEDKGGRRPEAKSLERTEKKWTTLSAKNNSI